MLTSIFCVSGHVYAIATCTPDATLNNPAGTNCVNFSNTATPIIAIQNDGTISNAAIGLTNPPAIKNGVYGSSASISTLLNNGTISSSLQYADAIDNSGAIGTLNNAGTISGVGAVIGNSGTITHLINSGVITSTGTGFAVFNTGTIDEFINSGTISSGVTGYGGTVGLWGNINTLTNTGTISGVNAVSIFNDGRVLTTLNNLQGAAGSALTYGGALPINYNIIIGGVNNYGQLSVAANNSYQGGNSSFVFGVHSSSTVNNNYLYTAVLSGVSASNITNLVGSTATGTYGIYHWTLSLETGSSTVWDLLFGSLGPSGDDTKLSLQLTANSLKSVYALQTASITNGLTYDCNVFDKEGICVSAGGRYDRVNTGDTHASNGLLIGSYKVDANTRVGAWVDQNLSASSATGVNLNNGNPMFGVFGVWNADKSGNGFEARLSAGYGDKDLTTTRQVIGTSEAGTGKTRLNTQGVSAVVSYNFSVAADLTVSPYLGARYTRVNANAYTEATSSAVTAPLTYGALKQETTTAMVGLKASARMSPECGVFGSVGAELDTSNKGNNYSATGVDGLTSIAFNADAKRLRGVASVGTYYDLDKTQRISLNAVYREEAFQKVNTLSTMATYTAGF